MGIDIDAYNWLNHNQLGYDIWNNKYRWKNESFDEWLDRVSGGDVEVKEIIRERKFLFGGRILANRGLENEGRKLSLSNCYVIAPPEDSIESIFDTAKKLARTYSYGGGCGIDLANLRPRGSIVRNAAKETTGAVSFMDLYSMVTGLISQKGRRGALMISMPVNHPDIEEFVGVKSDLNRVTKANISVRMSDAFMAAVKLNQPFTLSFTSKATGQTITRDIQAAGLFHKICEENWDYAEPGVLFWDRINNWNILSCDDSFEYAGTNPCAEEPLPRGGSCLLSSINLSEFVNTDGSFNFDGFRYVVSIAVTALNKVLDEGLPLHPLEEQRESVKNWRQIGLGIFGLADMLIKMNLTYGEQDAIDLCDAIGYAMASRAIETSAYLAKDEGPYPMYHKDKVLQSAWLTTNATRDVMRLVDTFGLRNSQLLTCAPTGSLSTMLGVSGGIEPIFANYYTRKTESLKGHDEYYKVYTPIVKEYMDQHGLKDDAELPNCFVTAPEIDYKKRIGMQAIWQNHIDASISSTVNLPNSATVEDVENLYMEAWLSGLKGITIFRDGCKRTGILTTDKTPENKDTHNDDDSTTIPRGMILKADDNCIGRKRTIRTGCGTLHIEAYFDPDTGELLETFLNRGSSGTCASNLSGLSRMISLSARGGVDIGTICDQLKSSLPCPSYAVRSATKHDTNPGNCCPTAIGNALMDMYKEVQSELFDLDLDEVKTAPARAVTVKEAKDLSKPPKKDVDHPSDRCPVCGSPLLHTGGCHSCANCGWSRCE